MCDSPNSCLVKSREEPHNVLASGREVIRGQLPAEQGRTWWVSLPGNYICAMLDWEDRWQRLYGYSQNLLPNYLMCLGTPSETRLAWRGRAGGAWPSWWLWAAAWEMAGCFRGMMARFLPVWAVFWFLHVHSLQLTLVLGLLLFVFERMVGALQNRFYIQPAECWCLGSEILPSWNEALCIAQLLIKPRKRIFKTAAPLPSLIKLLTRNRFPSPLSSYRSFLRVQRNEKWKCNHRASCLGCCPVDSS